MKKNILILCLLGTSIYTHAQEATWFEAEGQTFYELRDCTPGSDVLFYTREKGTQMIKSQAADESGVCRAQAAKSFRPDFAVNTKEPGAKGASGTGMSRAYGQRAFSFQHPGVREQNGTVVLSWDGAAANGLSFEVLRSNDGSRFQRVDKIPASSPGDLLPYSVTDLEPGTFYQVRILDPQGGVRYTSRLLMSGKDLLKVYPTISNDRFSIEFSEADGQYRLLNELGQVAQQGSLLPGKTSVSTNGLASGPYFIVVQSGGRQLAARVIKL